MAKDKPLLRVEGDTIRIRFSDGAELILTGEEAGEIGEKLQAAAKAREPTTIIIEKGGHRYTIDVANIH